MSRCYVFIHGSIWAAILSSFYLNLRVLSANAQTAPPTPSNPVIPNFPQTRPVPSSLPSPPKPLVPPPQIPQAPEIKGSPQTTIKVQRFVFKGNTVFSDKQLEAVTTPFLGREITFAELLQARSAVSQLYISKGYITSGAFIPAAENQRLQPGMGVVTIQVVEGKLEAINITGSDRLRHYVRSRLQVASSPVFNEQRLLEALRLLQVDPLVKTISAELTAGSQPERSRLNVQIAANQPLQVQAILDNYRSPAVGSIERGIQFSNANLLGLGDRLSLTYLNTDGSNGGDGSYTMPINAHNGTVSFTLSVINSSVIEQPFSQLDILGSARSYNLTVRQPLIRSADANSTQELAVGLTGSRQESESSLLGQGFPLSSGADSQGRTRLSVLRFFQEYTRRSEQEALFARSQFSVGLGLGATINPNPPDGRFFAWLGQAQYVRLLAPDTPLILRGDLQVADRALVPIEQLSIGGPDTVRGYRRDLLLANSGALASAEVRIPIFRSIKLPGVLQLAPFVDFGSAFGISSDINLDQPSTLASVGIGLQWQMEDRLSVRLDYGVPLVSVESTGASLQEQGFSFSLLYNPL